MSSGGRQKVAAYTGLIEVKWTKVHEDVIKHLDINKDGCARPAMCKFFYKMLETPPNCVLEAQEF